MARISETVGFTLNMDRSELEIDVTNAEQTTMTIKNSKLRLIINNTRNIDVNVNNCKIIKTVHSSPKKHQRLQPVINCVNTSQLQQPL